MGRLYQRGNTWWLQYYRSGKLYRESASTSNKGTAVKLLKAREGSIAEGKFPGLKVEKTTFDEIAKDYFTDYRVNKRKTAVRAEISISCVFR